jgi:prefoldin subunit 5
MKMMNESLMSINERYNMILDKIDAIRANIQLIAADELEAAMIEIDKYETILKQLEDLYPEEVSGRHI